MKCFKILIFIVHIIMHNFAVDGSPPVFKDRSEFYLEDPCTLLNGLQGICQKYQTCDGPEKELLKQKKFSEVKRCGFDRDEPLFCCSKPSEEVNENNEILPASELNTAFSKLLCNNSEKLIRLSKNINNGKHADVREFPHQVALGYQDNPGSPYDFKCGGSLITERIILTAAHCVNNNRPVIVRLGRTSLNLTELRDYGDAVDRRISDIIIHTDYRRKTRQNDIALIHLKGKVTFSDYIQPICFPSSSDVKNKNLTVTGYGTIDVDTKERSDWLQKAIVRETSLDDCRANVKAVDPENDIVDTQFCALGSKGEDACWGDSGGPIFYDEDGQYRLYGITSYGIGCGSTPAVYTKVEKFHDWIAKELYKN